MGRTFLSGSAEKRIYLLMKQICKKDTRLSHAPSTNEEIKKLPTHLSIYGFYGTVPTTTTDTNKTQDARPPPRPTPFIGLQLNLSEKNETSIGTTVTCSNSINYGSLQSTHLHHHHSRSRRYWRLHMEIWPLV